jgi:hypothetical protein
MSKRLILLLLLAATAAISVRADFVTIVDNGGPYKSGNSSGAGGEFTVLPIGFDNSGFAASTRNIFQNGTFQTFCLEKTADIKASVTYNVTPNNMTVPSGILLNKGTAFLFEQFASGLLSGYNYNPAGRVASAGALQQEIWHLMGNQAPLDPVFDAVVTAALGASALDPVGPGDTKVVVLNVWNLNAAGARQDHQDLLYIDPPSVPDGGLTLALLGVGLTGVGFVSRRARK